MKQHMPGQRLLCLWCLQWSILWTSLSPLPWLRQVHRLAQCGHHRSRRQVGRAAKFHAGAPCLQDLPQAITQDAPLQGVCIFLGRLFDVLL